MSFQSYSTLFKERKGRSSQIPQFNKDFFSEDFLKCIAYIYSYSSVMDLNKISGGNFRYQEAEI